MFLVTNTNSTLNRIIIKGRYTAEMGSKHEITIHTEPLLFSLSYPQKKTIAYCCTLKSTPPPPSPIVQTKLFSLYGHRTQFFSPLYIEQ